MYWRGAILLFFTLNGLVAQNPVIDSLSLELASLEEGDFRERLSHKKAHLNLDLGLAYCNNGAYQQADRHLENARVIAAQTGDSLLLATALNYLGESHLKRGKPEKAIPYLEQAFRLAVCIQSWEHLKTASAHLYTIHKAKNDHAIALRYYELFQSAKDTLIKGEHIRTITRLEKTYTDRVEQLEESAQLQQMKFISVIAVSGFTVAVMLLLFLIVFYRLKQAKEREKRKIQEQLLVQERMASLGMLTAGIAHEIKNPLNFINNFAAVNKRLIAQVLQEIEQHPGSWPPRTLPYVLDRLHDLKQNSADIEASGREINRIVHTMMDHSRGTSDALRLIDLNELTEENINLVYQSYRATHPDFQIQIEKQFDPDLPKIELYPHNIARVLINILSNAFYALNLKHREFPDYEPQLRVSTNSSPEFVEVIIRDNGPGIPAEMQQKIFTPFFTTKPVGMGNTGLGLSISYNIVVHEHHGKLKVTSNPGEFTQFEIILPRYHEVN